MVRFVKDMPTNKRYALMLALLAGVILAIQPLAWGIKFIQSQKNLLANPGFELEDTSWLVEGTRSESVQWTFDSATKFSGNRSIQLFLTPSGQWVNGVGVKQYLPVLTGRRYRFGARFNYESFKGENANAVVFLVKQFGANDQVIRNPNPIFLDPDYSIVERIQPDQEDWFEQNFSFQVDETTRAIEVTLGLFGPSPGMLRIDEVQLKADVVASVLPTLPMVVLALFLLASAYTVSTFFEPSLNYQWGMHLKKPLHTRQRLFLAVQIGLLLCFIYVNPSITNWSKEYVWPIMSTWGQKAQAYLLGTKNVEDILVEMSPLTLPNAVQTNLPVYDLHLTPQSIMQLEGILQTLRKQQVLLAKDQIWLDANFVYLDQMYPVQVRLRGDLPDHWRGPRKSWRVKFKTDQLFNSTREINLIIPSDKAYISDYVFNNTARKMGLLTLKDQFVLLEINGQLPSLYYQVEHFQAELLAANNRPEGHIFTTADTWVQTIKSGFGTASEYLENDTDRTMAEMRSYTEIIPQDSIGITVLHRLIELLYDHQAGIAPEQIEPFIDIEKYLKYNALRMIFGSFHSNWGNNLKLYFDPTTGRFEPIPWDVNNFQLPFADHTFEKKVAHGGPLDKAVLRNNAYQFQRNKYIWDFLENSFADMLNFYDQTFEQVKPYLDHKAHADIRANRQTLVKNAALLRGVLSFSRAFAIVESPTYQKDAAETTPYYYRIELLNDSFSPLRLQAISFKSEQHFGSEYKLYRDANENGMLDEDDQLLDHIQISQQQDIYQITNINQIIYSDRDENLVPIPRPYNVFLALDKMNAPLLLTDFEFDLQNAVTEEIVSSDYIFVQTVYQHFYTDYEAIYQSRNDFLTESPIFQPGVIPLPENAVVLPAGTYTLEEHLIIPKGLEVYIEPGVQILSEPGISIVSYSPIMAVGTEESPILFDAIDDTQGWGVLGLTLVEKESRFEYVHFYHTGEAKINGIYFSGGLAAYNSDVAIAHNQFSNAVGEDALNVKNGRALIEDTLFSHNASDAIDLDWAKESIIIGSTFENNLGDAIDLSGTDIPIVNNYIYGSGDKGISVGEMSSPLIFNNFITNNTIGIAVKDLSEAQILSNTLLDNETSLALYQKKPEFGGGRARLINTLIWNSSTPIQLDDNSTVYGEVNNIQGGLLNAYNLTPAFNSSQAPYVLDIDNPPQLLYEANLSFIRQLTNLEITRGPIGVIPAIYETPSVTIKKIITRD